MRKQLERWLGWKEAIIWRDTKFFDRRYWSKHGFLRDIHSASRVGIGVGETAKYILSFNALSGSISDDSSRATRIGDVEPHRSGLVRHKLRTKR